MLLIFAAPTNASPPVCAVSRHKEVMALVSHKKPIVNQGCFVAPSACIVGKVIFSPPRVPIIDESHRGVILVSFSLPIGNCMF